MGFWTNAHGTIAGKFETVVSEEAALDYLEKVVGKQLRWEEERSDDDMLDEWNYAFDHPELYLPLGSEGSLRANYSYDSTTGEYEIKIHGNLRDVYNTDWILKWFVDIREKLNPKLIRVKIATDDGFDIQKWKRVSPCSKTRIMEVVK